MSIIEQLRNVSETGCDPELIDAAIARIAELEAEVVRLTGALKKANDQAEHFEREWYLRGDALEKLDQWAQAYPIDVFTEPDWAKSNEALKANGLSLTSISAANMRHVITGVQKIIQSALSTQSSASNQQGEAE